MQLDELIAKLPEEYQPWGKQYGNALIDMGFNELTAWADLIANAKWQDAYKALAARMTTKQLIESQEAVNAKLKVINKRNASHVAMQEQMVKDAMTIGILLLKAKVDM